MGETKEKDEAKNRDAIPKESTTNSISSKRVALVSFLVGIVGVLAYFILIDPLILQQDISGNFYDYYAAGADNISPQVLDVFVSYDENLDGKLSIKEFVPIAERLQGAQESQFLSALSVKANWDWNGEQITLNGSFKPLVLSSMTKFSSTSYPGYDNSIKGLKGWTKMATPQAIFPVSAFSIFLPPDSNTQVGTPWYIIEPRISKYAPSLSSNHYIPPPVRGKAAVLVHHLLAMFHPRPFVYTRFGPQGTAACIQAENEKYLKIAFRIHAEFQVNTPPLFPFWFSPAQFAGTIIISRDGTHITSFEMAVPANKSLNVDMEWLLSRVDDTQTEQEPEKSPDGSELSEGNEGNMEVDIGFLPQMELKSLGPSVLKENKTLDEKKSSTETKGTAAADEQEMPWKSEISREMAENILALHFYPFKKVTYHPFKEAFQLAKQQNKPVHHILLWGALDDQSC